MLVCKTLLNSFSFISWCLQPPSTFQLFRSVFIFSTRLKTFSIRLKVFSKDDHLPRSHACRSGFWKWDGSGPIQKEMDLAAGFAASKMSPSFLLYHLTIIITRHMICESFFTTGFCSFQETAIPNFLDPHLVALDKLLIRPRVNSCQDPNFLAQESLEPRNLGWKNFSLFLKTNLSKRNLAVRQSTGTEKNPSVCGEWMSTVITLKVFILIRKWQKVKVMVNFSSQKMRKWMFSFHLVHPACLQHGGDHLCRWNTFGEERTGTGLRQCNECTDSGQIQIPED